MHQSKHSELSAAATLDFESFMNQHIGGLISISTDGRITGLDTAAAKALGYDISELKGKSIHKFLSGLQLPASFSPKEYHGRATIQSEEAVRELTYTIRGGWSTETDAYFLILHFENSISNSLSLYRHMFEWIPTGLVIYSTRKSEVVTCNQRLLAMLQQPDKTDALQQTGLTEALQPHLWELERNREHKFEICLQSPAGQPIHLQAITALIPALDKSLTLVLLQDITQQKVNAQALKENRNTLEAIISNAVDGIIIINDRGEIKMTNEATTRLFGYAPEEMQGQNIRMLMPEPHRSQHDGYLSNYLKTGKEKIIGVGREVQGQRKNGERFPFRLGVSKIETEQGLLFTGVIHDLSEEMRAKEKIIRLNRELEQKVEERTEKLTDVVNKLLQSNVELETQIKERKSAEEALRKNEEELKKALEREKELSELKSRFVSMASHEFRTPLTTIASSSELIKLYTESTQQEKREKHLRRIQSAVTNLTGILGDFLSLSKLEEGKIHNVPAEVDLEALFDEALDDIHVLLKPNQTIEKTFEGMGQPAKIDRKILKNILLNLLSNAIKYSDAGSTVWLEARHDGRQLKASIRDEGIGIPESDQKHLFSRFFRADNAVNIQGTGLGLNIVHRYLKLLGGHIDFESIEGEGTTFTFEVPVANQ